MTTANWELLSYIVTVIGLPLAIYIYLHDQFKERENEEDEVYQLVSVNYQDLLKVALDHADLKLFSDPPLADPTEEQRERMIIYFSMLVSLFERAYLLLYEELMSGRQLRRWRSWEDYMQEWCRRADFREALPELLRGEDPDFVAYIQGLVKKDNGRSSAS